MRVLFYLAALLLVPAAVQAQQVSSLNPPATTADIATLQAQIPQPASTVPAMEVVGGTAGTAPTFRRGDAIQPRITRAGVVTTDSNGAWTITWSTPLNATPVVLPIPSNTSTQPIVCNVATASITGATGRCWLSRTLPATLTLLTNLINFDIFGGAATGISVQVLAIPPTQ